MSTSITADMVKKLRDLTGCGFLDCKKALEEADGNIEGAIDVMRKAGQAKAAKKTERVAKEGLICIEVAKDAKSAFMVEVNSETDFVARNEGFKNFAHVIAIRGLTAQVGKLEDFLALPIEVGKPTTIEKAREELVAKIGENIQVRRISFIQTSHNVYHYLHGGRIGVLVELSGSQELGKDIAMHIAASKPIFVSAKEIPEAQIEHEKEIYLAQALASGKPQAIAEKMVSGRLESFVKEVTLLGQPFVKDPSIDVASLLKQHNAEVHSFVRFELGN